MDANGKWCPVFEQRTGLEQKQLALEWLELPADQRQRHFDAHGQQWSELMRLPYFDPVRQTVIGPMHCLLNGIVKNLWYDTWIKGTKTLRPNTDGGTLRELDFIHQMLKKFEVPSWVGRLPKVIGEPAGGSLSSDEWKWLAILFGPVVLPPLWYLTQSDADDEHKAAHKRYTAKVKSYEKSCEKAEGELDARSFAKWQEKHPAPDLPSQLRRVEGEIPMFLSLSASLRLLLGRSLTDENVERGNTLLLDHLKQYCELYNGNYLKFNQHWSTHVPHQVFDLGPIYGFWEFPYGCVNKSLKSINTNNRRKEELELTMLKT
ncbi:hypothetical protein AURDEDRAFT_174242 [Auricularia subglabra TFB-10046 SS5]|uniref:Uncharacterized protein n=1 Tax=Auricularia subglabra (strain TFB-10046 / SS5) TaxID=717982 RepID=J0D9Y8_AURST|nr:hypothetical protein AURDEDRAFT_174242 [Auricularia subglabra TFB-10046 SS5]